MHTLSCSITTVIGVGLCLYLIYFYFIFLHLEAVKSFFTEKALS